MSVAARQTPDWKQWEGEIAGEFPLEELLGSSDGSAVFRSRSTAGDAAIKLVTASGSHAAELMEWCNRARTLDDPHFIRIIKTGTWAKSGLSMAYLAMEYADENLAEVLRERALTADETLEMLQPVAEALASLHEGGLVHGRLKPSNIFAVNDTLKLSSDSVSVGGASSDMRALAALTVQALTQQKLTFSKSDSETNLIASLPLLFQEIVRNCSGQNGRRQWTASELARWLPSQRDPIPETPAAAVRLPRSKSRRRKLTFYAIVFALGLVLLGTVGAFLRPILRNGTAEPVSSAAPSSVKPVEQTPIASASTVARKQPIEKPKAPAPPPERAHSEEATQSPVAGQVLPEITDKARSTIHGTVVIMVRVDVDQSGEVTDAVLQTKRSPFLGRMSLAAARQWKFPAANEEAPRRWLVRFEITRTDTKASSTRVLATKTAEKSVEP